MCNFSCSAQYIEVLGPMDKGRRLEQILRSQEAGSKVIIFCSTKKMCDQLSRSLSRQFGAAAIHGDKSQNERDYVLNQFRAGKTPILVATDVAARGLDIKDIRFLAGFLKVLNFVVVSIELLIEYVHLPAGLLLTMISLRELKTMFIGLVGLGEQVQLG